MPLLTPSGELGVVVSQGLGDLGPGQTAPGYVEWRWYYHLPPLAVWLLVAILLIVVKENRNWRAWLILIPALLLNMVIWPWLLRLVPSGLYSFSSRGEPLDFAFNSLAGAWTALWLMTPWLVRRRPPAAFLLAVGFLATAGMLPHAAAFGIRYVYFRPELIWYGTCALGLVLGMTLSGLCCRRNYSPRRFLLWLVPWTLVGVSLGVTLYAISLYVHHAPSATRDSPGYFFIRLLLPAAVLSLSIGGFVYLVNSPFLFLASRVPTYRDRMRHVLRLSPPTGTAAS